MRPSSTRSPFTASASSRIRTFSGRIVKRLPSRSTMFDTPTKPATNSFTGCS